jgi:hypothetical protein
MSDLYAQLKEIRQDRFEPNDRIIFELFDHDFHLNYQGPGWTLYNLQLILAELDISNFFCLLLTNQPGQDEYTVELQKKLTDDDFPIRTITTLLNADWLPDEKPVRAVVDAGKIEKSFCLLSRQARPHRTFFMSKIMASGLANHGIIGYNNIEHELLQSNNNSPESQANMKLSFLEIPPKYQRVLLKDKINKIQYQNFVDAYPNYKNFKETIDIENKYLSCSLTDNITPISRGFLYIGIETEVELQKVHSSRISLRGIVEARPFVLLSSVGALSFLRDRGFKTFNDVWDESYDEIVDLEERVDRIIDIVKEISNLSKTQLIELYCKLRPIIEYNQNFYFNEFSRSESQRLDRACKQNLKTP